MSTPVTHSSNTTQVRDEANYGLEHSRRNSATETKPSFKTTELVVYVLSVLGVLIASFVVDANQDGQGFSSYQGWFLVTLLTIGYLISRGLAKSGSHSSNNA